MSRDALIGIAGIAGIVGIVMGLGGCARDKPEVGAQASALLGAPQVSPLSGGVGDTVTITATNLGDALLGIYFSNQTTVTPGIEGTSFAHGDANTVTVKVPPGTKPGPLFGQRRFENGTAYVQLPSFTVTSAGAPTISAITITSSVVVTGTNFTGVTGVSVGGVPVTKYSLNGDTKLSFSRGSLSGPVTVTNSVDSVTSVDTIPAIVPPVWTLVSPPSATEGETITITGTNLDVVTALQCSGNAVPMTAQSATTITFAAPAGLYQCELRMLYAGGAEYPPAVAITPTTPPQVDSYSPTSGPTGTQLTLSGARLGLVGAVTVDGISVTTSLNGDQTLYLNVPPSATAGVIKVTSSLGTTTVTPSYTITSSTEMRIDLVSPSSAKAGDTITITGANFPNESLTVWFPTLGTATATATWVNATTLTVVAPAFVSAGSLQIDAASSSTYGGFIQPLVVDPPTITSVSPSEVYAGDRFHINGTNLLYAQTVTIGGAPFDIRDRTMSWVAVYTDKPLSGSLAVEIVTPTGTAQLTVAFTGKPTPTITSISPQTVAPGDLVTVTGTDLDQVFSVWGWDYGVDTCLGACDASCACLVSPTQLTFHALPQTIPMPLRIETDTEVITSAQKLTVSDGIAPLINYVSAESLAVDGELIVLGDHFSGLLYAELGGQHVEFQLLSNDALRLRALSTSGTLRIVTVAGAVEWANPIAVALPTYSGDVTITSVEPAEASLGQTIVIKGSGLSPFSGYGYRSISGGGSGGLQVVSDSELRLACPSSTFQRLWIASPNSQILLPVRPLAPAAPTLFSFSPQTALPGTALTLYGALLTGDLSVAVGGQLWGPNARAGVARFNVPLDAISGAMVVTNAAGDSAPVGALTVLPYSLAVTVTPSQAAPGDKVIVSGLGVGDSTLGFADGWYATPRRIDADTIELTVDETAPTAVLHVGNLASTAELRVLAAGAPIADALVNEKLGNFQNRFVLGRNFAGMRRVSIGGRDIDFQIESDRRLRLTLPKYLSNAPLILENAVGRTVTSLTLAGERPTITGISKTTVDIGDTVTITGTNLRLAYGYFMKDIDSSDQRLFSQISDTSLSFVVDEGLPSGRLMLYYFDVDTRDPIEVATIVVNSKAAPIVPAPVDIVDQREVSSIRVRGDNFGGLVGITVGGVAAESAYLYHAQELEFSVPFGAPSGPIVITNSLGSVTAGQYTAVDDPGALATLTAITPTAGTPGTRVLFEGTRLDALLGVRVGKEYFHSPSFGATKAIFEIPRALSSGEIELVMLDGRLVKTGVRWTQLGRLAVLAATPAGADAGEIITISGDGFWGVTTVTIGGVAVDFTIVDNQTIEVTAPDTAVAGAIVVSTGDETFTTPFSYSTLGAPDLAVPTDLAIASADLAPASGDLATTDDGGAVDGGVDMTTGKPKDKGCAVGGEAPAGSFALLIGALLVARLRRRRHAA